MKYKKVYCVDCDKILGKFAYKHKSKKCRSCGAKGKKHSLKTKRKISLIKKILFKNPKNHPAYKNGRYLKDYYCIDCGKKLKSHTAKKCLHCSLLDKNIKQKVFDTNIELKFKDELIKRNIQFKHPYRIKNHPADFYIPIYNLIVECDGYYWHNKKGAKEKDARHNAMMRNSKYFVKRLKGENILKEKIDYDKMFNKYKLLQKKI